MPFDPLTVAFALVAIVALWKLYSVLGQNNGFRRDSKDTARRGFGKGGRQGQAEPGKNGQNAWNQGQAQLAPPAGKKSLLRLPGAPKPAPVELPPPEPRNWAPFVEGGDEAVVTSLDQLSDADKSLVPKSFMSGAKTAYEAVLNAFAAGDRKLLGSLLTKEVLDGFAAAIAEREKRGETLLITFVSVAEPRIAAASVQNRMARVTIRFLSEQITATKSGDGALVGGSVDQIVATNDLWTFQRPVNARDPNWKLAVTEAGA